GAYVLSSLLACGLMVREGGPLHDAGITIVERLPCLLIHDDTAVALCQYTACCCRELRETSNVGTARSDRIVIIRRAVQHANGLSRHLIIVRSRGCPRLRVAS